jgi:hypothetical protein
MRSTTAVCLAIAIIAVAACARSGPPAAATGAGWATSPAAILVNFRGAYPGLQLAWSPVVHEPGIGDYHAIWFTNGQLRAYIGHDGAVTAVSVSEDTPEDLAAANREAVRFVAATLPRADANQRTATATALANLVSDGSKASVQLAGVDFKVSAGSMHYSIRARPVS